MSSIILIMQINLKNMRFQEWVFFGLRFCLNDDNLANIFVLMLIKTIGMLNILHKLQVNCWVQTRGSSKLKPRTTIIKIFAL
jgi:hypothetical protein